jgi:23S rRNA (guanosine2251-2'-O)-methyltransferase
MPHWEHLEGRASVLAALDAYERRFQVILLKRGMPEARRVDLLERAGLRRIPVRDVERRELDALAHGATHGGVIAICTPKPRQSPAQLAERLARQSAAPLILLLEGVDDARNLGFALRSADALGAHAVMIKKHLWDFDPVEVARPSSGAYERLPLVQIENVSELGGLKRLGLRLIGCLGGAKRSLHETDLAGPAILAVGGEKRGLSGALRERCDVFMTIPTRPGGPSLSLSHAAAIVLAEAARQRRAPQTPGGADRPAGREV